jgi:hypothetical protein
LARRVPGWWAVYGEAHQAERLRRQLATIARDPAIEIPAWRTRIEEVRDSLVAVAVPRAEVNLADHLLGAEFRRLYGADAGRALASYETMVAEDAGLARWYLRHQPLAFCPPAPGGETEVRAGEPERSGDRRSQTEYRASEFDMAEALAGLFRDLRKAARSLARLAHDRWLDGIDQPAPLAAGAPPTGPGDVGRRPAEDRILLLARAAEVLTPPDDGFRAAAMARLAVIRERQRVVQAARKDVEAGRRRDEDGGARIRKEEQQGTRRKDEGGTGRRRQQTQE